MKRVFQVFLFMYLLSMPIELLGDTTNKTISLFDNKNLNGWTIANFGTQGNVYAKGGKITLGMGDGATGITWSGDVKFPTMNYEASLQARRISGNDFFCGVTFPVGNDHLTLVVGGWGGFLVGLSCIDGFDASENETGSMQKFENNRWYTIKIRVAENVVRAWIDDKLVAEISAADHELSLRPEVLLSRPFGITSWYTESELRNIKLTYID